MRRTTGVVLVVCALALTACGASDTRDAGSTTTTTEKKATTTTTTTAAPTTTTTPSPTYRLLSQPELEAAFVGLQDLPVGYSQQPPESDTSTKTYCDYKPPFAPKVEATRWFQKGGGMSAEVLGVNLRQFASPAEAKAAFDAMTQALASCPGETYEGTKLTYAPMAAPKLGDASFGLKTDADGSTVLQFYVLVGPTIIKAGGGGLINTSAEESLSLLEPQVKAYQAAAGS